MRGFHVITGIPRSGSTLLCNILNQNPDFYASSTSPIPELIGTFINRISSSAEIQAALARDSAGVTGRLNKMLLRMIEVWYEQKTGVVFDKSRGWSFNSLLLARLFPQTKVIACVRDLRNVFASIEKQHAQNPIFDLASSPNEKTMLVRADTLMSPNGLIGQSAIGTQDLMDRMEKRTHVLHYESFSINPKMKMKEIYEFIGEPYFEHDFENVENTSEDLDALYLNKFPHDGSGEVRPSDRKEWRSHVPVDLAGLIHQRYPKYNELFGY